MAVTNYYTVNGEIIGEKTAGSPRVDYLTDALGSVTATVNSSAQVVNTYRYKPFGTQLAKTGPGPDPAFQWVGEQGYGPTGRKYSEQYARGRHIDTTSGRFPSKDPIGIASGDMNPYKYGRNAPVSRMDPTGLLCQKPPIPKACQNSSGGWKGCADICKAASIDPIFKQKVGKQASPGMVVCCGTQACSCLFSVKIGTDYGGNPVTYKPGDCPSLDACITAHEERHIKIQNNCTDRKAGLYPSTVIEDDANQEECLLRCNSIGCMQRVLKGKAPSQHCLIQYDILLRRLRSWIGTNCKTWIPNVASCNTAGDKPGRK